MFFRLKISISLALLLSLVFAIPVLAGGWAVITLDELPAGIVAGKPFTVGFTVLQHGKTPMTDLSPTITANLYKDEEFVVPAEPEGKPGHYTATLTFPKEGEWMWSIQAFTMDQAMPMLNVAAPIPGAANPPVSKTEPAISFTSPMLIASGLALVVGLVGGLIAFRRKSRLVMALTVLCLLVGIALFIAGAGTTSSVEAQGSSSPTVAEESSVSQVELGRQLFLAKGCITCHTNSKAARSSEYWTIEMGATNLSNFSANPQVILMRLKDPSSVKSDTQMPNLDLTEVEIEALVAFINSK
ncbi:MAG: c-type cytochrome [Chloroflexota bacterium]